MSRGVDHKGRSRTRGKFVALGNGLLTSAAWRTLGGSSVRYYIELRRRYNGMNNGELNLSLAEAERLLHMGHHTVLKAQQELVEKGLIQMRQQGGFRQRLATTWALTDEPVGTRRPGHEYKTWVPKQHRTGCRNSTDGEPRAPP